MSTIFASLFFANSITLLGVLMDIYLLGLVWFFNRSTAPVAPPSQTGTAFAKFNSYRLDLHAHMLCSAW
jgi:hypothetical protein